MNKAMRRTGLFVLCSVLAAGLAMRGKAQQNESTMLGQQTAPYPTRSSQSSMDPAADTTMRGELQRKQANLQNTDRQRRLVADTDKLLALATQLHTDVAKTDKNILSMDVVRRAEEIERLAKSVKDRMKG